MKKREIARLVAEKTDGITLVQIEDCIEAFFDVLVELVCKGESFNQKNFGTFKQVTRAARKARNPLTGEQMDLKESKAIKLVVSKNLKDKLKAL